MARGGIDRAGKFAGHATALHGNRRARAPARPLAIIETDTGGHRRVQSIIYGGDTLARVARALRVGLARAPRQCDHRARASDHRAARVWTQKKRARFEACAPCCAVSFNNRRPRLN